MRILKSSFVSCIGLSICVVSVVAIFGHVADAHRLYNWTNDDIGMALPTAICFLAVGLSLFTIGRNGNQ